MLSYHLPLELGVTALDVERVMIAKTNLSLPHYAAEIGSVWTSHYPSYCRLYPWFFLANVEFNLLGFTILDGHNGVDPNVLIPIVNVLRQTVVNGLDMHVCYTQSLDVEFVLYPKIGDIAALIAFTRIVLDLLGWQARSHGNRQDPINTHFCVSFTVPSTWIYHLRDKLTV